MKIINRPLYLDHIVSLLNRGMILILSGQRRVGKSYLLLLLKEWLADNRPESHVFYVNKEFQSFNHIATASDLYEKAVENLPEGGENYLLVDEVQDVENYEDALRSLYAEQRCQIVATGSNAYLFASELHTRLSGRYIEIPVYSLTYVEFLSFHNLEDSDENLRQFLRVGGLPGLSMLDIDNDLQVSEYLQGVYNTVLVKDVISREEMRNVPFIEALSSYIADNTGKLISNTNIARYMTSKGDKVSVALVGNYLRYLSNALIIKSVQRYDIHGKTLFDQIFKYYFADHGLRNLLCSFNILGSIEKILENVVYNALLAQGFKVTVGVLRVGEIDFVATKGSQKLYIQVCYLLASPETINRELGNLAKIKDNYPKYVVSMDPIGGEIAGYPGISVIPLRQFLMHPL